MCDIQGRDAIVNSNESRVEDYREEKRWYRFCYYYVEFLKLN